MLGSSSEWSFTLIFRLELPHEKDTAPWLVLELRLLNLFHDFKPELFEIRRMATGARTSTPLKPDESAAETVVDEGEPARSSKFLAPSTPYRTIVSKATWTYLNAQVMTISSCLIRVLGNDGTGKECTQGKARGEYSSDCNTTALLVPFWRQVHLDYCAIVILPFPHASQHSEYLPMGRGGSSLEVLWQAQTQSPKPNACRAGK